MTNRTSLTSMMALSLAASLLGCGDDAASNTTCGAGTIAQGDTCVPESTLACGPGTVEVGGQCVLPDGSAPTVAAVTPARELAHGGAAFTITGTGFTTPGAGDVTVTFGSAPAVFTIVNDTTITGTVPAAPAGGAVNVTVTTAKGAASTPFRYDGLYIADGRVGVPGKLYFVDPRDGWTLPIAPITSDAGATPRAVTGLAFGANGTLYASEATNGGGTGRSHLLSIDPATGAATAIAPLADATADHNEIADLEVIGTTLYGWTENGDDLVTIDPATGAVTVIADSTISSAGSGIAAVGDVLYGAFAENIGELTILDTTTGLGTAGVTLAGAVAHQVCALTTFQGTLVALLCRDDGIDGAGTLLATVDPVDGTVTVIGAAPPNADAITSTQPVSPTVTRFVPPTPAAPLALPTAPRCATDKASVRVAGRATGLVDAAALAGATRTFALGKRRTGAALAELIAAPRSARTVTLSACDGEGVVLPAAELRADPDRYVVSRNQRGALRIFDRVTGTRIAKNVVAIDVE